MSVESTTFKEAMARFASGVTIVTARHDGVDYGMTVSAFCSVSLTPPLVMVSIARSLYTNHVIRESGHFAVHLLAAAQQEWGQRFAGQLPTITDRFAAIAVERGITGNPLLPGCLAVLDCTLRAAHEAGDHTLFVGEVLSITLSEAQPPLLYFHRHWATLSEIGPDAGSSWPSDRQEAR